MDAYFFLTIESWRFFGESINNPPIRRFFCVSENDAVAMCRELYQPDADWLQRKSDAWLLTKLKNDGLFISFKGWKVIRITLTERQSNGS